MKVSFFVEFEIGQIVYITTDKDQSPAMVTGYVFTGSNNEIMYELTQGYITVNKWFSTIELSKLKDYIITSTN